MFFIVTGQYWSSLGNNGPSAKYLTEVMSYDGHIQIQGENHHKHIHTHAHTHTHTTSIYVSIIISTGLPFAIFLHLVSFTEVWVTTNILWPSRLRLQNTLSRDKTPPTSVLDMIQWHINNCRLFNTESVLYIYITNIWFGFVWFHGISTIVGYLMPNLLYTYILNI